MFMSATLPLEMKNQLIQDFQIVKECVIEADCERTELRYGRIIVQKREDLESKLVELLTIPFSRPGNKGIIICLNRSTPIRLQSVLPELILFPVSNLNSFENEDVDNIQRKEILIEWSDPELTENKYIVGTSVLLMGINYLNVEHVIFYEGMYSEIDLIQGTIY